MQFLISGAASIPYGAFGFALPGIVQRGSLTKKIHFHHFMDAVAASAQVDGRCPNNSQSVIKQGAREKRASAPTCNTPQRITVTDR